MTPGVLNEFVIAILMLIDFTLERLILRGLSVGFGSVRPVARENGDLSRLLLSEE